MSELNRGELREKIIDALVFLKAESPHSYVAVPKIIDVVCRRSIVPHSRTTLIEKSNPVLRKLVDDNIIAKTAYRMEAYPGTDSRFFGYKLNGVVETFSTVREKLAEIDAERSALYDALLSKLEQKEKDLLEQAAQVRDEILRVKLERSEKGV